MICPFDHVRSQKHASMPVSARLDTAKPCCASRCPSWHEVMPQVGHHKALQTLKVSNVSNLSRVRARAYTHLRAHDDKVGRLDTASNGKALPCPTYVLDWTPMKPLSMRDEMPIVSAFVDACRQVFGAAEVNASIRSALAGGDTFYASENGHTIGKPVQTCVFSVSGHDLVPMRKAKS